MTNHEETEQNAQLERCLELFAAHQQRLFFFISALIPSPADAEEVLQETNVVIWKRFEQFDPEQPGSDFFAWASRIALNQARNHLRKRSRSALTFNSELLGQLAAQWEQRDGEWEDRRLALRRCVQKLSDPDRDLLEKVYAPNAKVQVIAEEEQRTATSIYRSLRRIRRWLANCVKQRLRLDPAS
ncbi:RNA polymerase subunit sigma [Planctomycetales bacterium 10988]|nr:RNA polymerase subunit sigma [Planctomycetales bacterium 10988]